jgi:hypothetical protein
LLLRGQLRGGDDLDRGQGQTETAAPADGRDVARAPGGDEAAGGEEEDVQARRQQRIGGHLRVSREDLHGQDRGRAGRDRAAGPDPQPLREQHQQREPCRGVQDGRVAEVREHEARSTERDPRQEAAEDAGPDGPRVEEREEGGQDVARQGHQVRGHGRGYHQEDRVGRIEGADLDVRQQWEPAVDVGVPQREMPAAQDLRDVGAHRIVVEETIAGRRQHAAADEDGREEDRKEEGEPGGDPRGQTGVGPGVGSIAGEYTDDPLDFSGVTLHSLAGPRL